MRRMYLAVFHNIISRLRDLNVMRALRVMMIIGLTGLSDEHVLSGIATTTTEIA